MRVLKGKAASKGIAEGAAYLYRPQEFEARKEDFPKEEKEAQVEVYRNAVEQADRELEHIAERFAGKDADKGAIFEAHREILRDEAMEEEILCAITEEFSAPAYAVSSVYRTYAKLLSKAKDPLIAARAADITDVRNRLLRILYGEPAADLAVITENSIIIARDLMPSDTAMLDSSRVSGIVIEQGSYTSHTAILSRSLGIPAVLGVKDALNEIAPGCSMIIDGIEGRVVLYPDREEIESARARIVAFNNEKKKRDAYYLSRPAVTRDGTKVTIGINIGTPDADYHYCDFCGLFRTEILFMENDHLPSEEEQFAQYKLALVKAGGKPVTLRTLDIGGDKTLPYMELPKEDNPFLGERALRLCFTHQDIFSTQLRASYRASVFGKLQIMFPMVTSVEDFRRAKEIAHCVREQLAQEGTPFDPSVPLGIMIEVPAIAMVSDLIAKEADFASIGTNDLCQYTCAADRLNPAAAQYYQNFSPAMLRLLGWIADGFNREGKPLSVCGEMGGDPRSAVLLLGLGISKLSMNPNSIAEVKAAICGITRVEAAELALQAQSLSTMEQVLTLLREKGIE